MSKDRRHSAIMFTDIVGYTSLMGSDEDRAFEVLSKNRDIQQQLVEKYNGTLIKEMGDGHLISFNLASDAVYCAIEIQKKCKEQDIPLKIGIHEGEMVFEGDDVIGDAVNVASRLEADTHEGCITISGSVYRDIKNRKDIQTKFIKEKNFKNVDEPIKVYEVLCEEEDGNHGTTETKPNKTKSKNPYYLIASIVIVTIAILFIWKNSPINGTVDLDKSIAVMPFDNESAADDNIYFVNGMMEDIRNNLSKIGDIRVISKTSTEKYRDTNLSTSEIGKELGVSYLLEGTVQKIGTQVKIHAQLISVENDDHIWEDTYERDISDVSKVFKVQSDIAKIIAQELNASITPEERNNIETIPTTNLEAYNYYLKGIEYTHRSREEQDFKYAVQMFKMAIEQDSSFTNAWVRLAYVSRYIYWFGYDSSNEQLNNTKYYLDRAIKLDPQNVDVLIEEGRYYYHCLLDYETAINKLEKLARDHPNNSEIFLWMGYVYRRKGEFEKSIELINHAISLNAFYWESWFNAGETYVIIGNYREAQKYYERVIELNPSNNLPIAYLGQLYLLTGNVNYSWEILNSNSIKIENSDVNRVSVNVQIAKKDFVGANLIIDNYPNDSYFDNLNYVPKSLMRGIVFYLANDLDNAKSFFEKSIEHLNSKINTVGEDSRFYSSLGISYAGLGLKKKAIEAGLKALTITDISRDAYRGFYRELDMAKIFLLVGENEKCISKLNFLIDQYRLISVELLKLDPFWNPIREMDGFKAIINNPEYQVNLSDN